MFGRVEISLGTQENVVVPDRAIVKQTGSGNRYVYVYSNGKVAYNKVELGQRMGDSYELLSGGGKRRHCSCCRTVKIG